jgi:Spy/CpxP family protein refolding chaperone
MMNSKTMRNGIAAITAVAVMAIGATAMAGKGMGSGQDGRGYGGCGQQRRGDCAYGQRLAGLTPEQQEQMETERQAFFESTKAERQDLYAKRLELRAEIAKREPDKVRAADLQKQVSALRSSLDQKRLDHIMAMREIHPDAGRGFFGEGRGMGRRGMGYHHGQGRGMGDGPDNCPNK